MSAITAGSIAGGLVVVAALVVAIVACARKARRLERRQQLEARKRAQAALHTTHHMNHSAVLVPASTFVSLGELRAYEDLRDEGKLIYRDSFSALAHGDDYIVFFSHQWTSFDHPDPANVQYPVMVAALLKLAEEKEADNAVREGKTRASEAGDATEVVSILERMLVWVDYSSIPQRSEATLKLAIQSLSAYSSLAAEFVIVAPTCHHLQTGAVCDFESYRRRAWCRAEQLCHLFRNGMDDMWLATSPKHIERLHTSKKHPTNATPEELYERGAITSEEVRAPPPARPPVAPPARPPAPSPRRARLAAFSLPQPAAPPSPPPSPPPTPPPLPQYHRRVASMRDTAVTVAIASNKFKALAKKRKEGGSSGGGAVAPAVKRWESSGATPPKEGSSGGIGGVAAAAAAAAGAATPAPVKSKSASASPATAPAALAKQKSSARMTSTADRIKSSSSLSTLTPERAPDTHPSLVVSSLVAAASGFERAVDTTSASKIPTTPSSYSPPGGDAPTPAVLSRSSSKIPTPFTRQDTIPREALRTYDYLASDSPAAAGPSPPPSPPEKPAPSPRKSRRSSFGSGKSAAAVAPAKLETLRSSEDMTEDDWLSESIRVFAGQITDEMDFLNLVMPILGLYAELYDGTRLGRGASLAQPHASSSPRSSAYRYSVCKEDSSEAIPFARKMLDLVRDSKDEIFPPTFRPQKTRRLARRGSSITAAPKKAAPMKVPPANPLDIAMSASVALAAPAPGAPPAELELFGDMIKTVEEIIDENAEVRKHLHDAVLKRRGIIVEKKQNLAAGRESSTPRGGGSGSGSSLKGLTAKKSWRQERRNSKGK